MLPNRTNTTTMMSVMKSDSEWTASAIIAADPPTKPATNFNTSSSMLMMLPRNVTPYIMRWRSSSDMLTSEFFASDMSLSADSFFTVVFSITLLLSCLQKRLNGCLTRHKSQNETDAQSAKLRFFIYNMTFFAFYRAFFMFNSSFSCL